MSLNKSKLIEIISDDPKLTHEEKGKLQSWVNNNSSELDKHKGVIEKFLALSPMAKTLLALAGFGLGKYLLDRNKNYDKFLQYDEKTKLYNIGK